ncbi:hypothetical protein [Flavobacterium sp.]|uniref:hypothetical protein n=1 Tax=Flavobacterium sp. TaxID=239 RepID=UPI003752D77C
MIISVLVHGILKSIMHRKNMFPSLFYGIEIGGIIRYENGLRSVRKPNAYKERAFRSKNFTG